VLANFDPSIQLCVHGDFDEGGTRRTTDDCVKFPVRPSIGNFTRKYCSQHNHTTGTMMVGLLMSSKLEAFRNLWLTCMVVSCSAQLPTALLSAPLILLPGLSRVINSLLASLLTYWCAYTCEIARVACHTPTYHTRVYLDDFSVIPMVIPIPIDIPIARQDALLLCLAVPFAARYNAKAYYSEWHYTDNKKNRKAQWVMGQFLCGSVGHWSQSVTHCLLWLSVFKNVPTTIGACQL